MFTHKKLFTGGITILILVLAVQTGLFDVPSAHAITFNVGTGAGLQGSLGDDLVNFIGKAALINTFMHVILLVLLQFLGYLLQADFFNDPAMMSALYGIWVLSRDIMNILFALMLIGVSFFVIITGKTDKAKEHVVNFVVAVILVNFSWFFPRVIIDIANVVTATVYSVPNTVMSVTPCMTIEATGAQPCRVITRVDIFPNPAEATAFKAACGPGGVCTCTTSIECHETSDLVASMGTMSSANTVINGLAVSFARISVMAKIPTALPPGAVGGGLSAKDSVMVSFQIALSIMLAFMVQIAVVLPLLGLAVGLFLRIIILWVTTAFMPFSFIGYVVNGKLGTAVFGFETDIWKEFINAAFLPAIVAIPFSIGFIMLSAVASIPEPTGAFPMTFKVPILAGVNKWWQLIWTMAAIAIIWTGSFKALKRSELVGNITEKIRGFGQTVFSGVAQLPLLAPIPLPGGPRAGVNLGTLVNGPKVLSASIAQAASGTSGRRFGDIFSQRLGLSSGTGSGSPEGIAESLRNDRDNTNKIIGALRELGANPGLAPDKRKEQFDIIRKSAPGLSGLSETKLVDVLGKLTKVKNPKGELKDLMRGINENIGLITPKD